MAKKKDKSASPEREGISPALWLVPILAIFILIYYFILSMGYDLPTFDRTMEQLKWGSVIILGVLLGVLAGSHALDRRATAVCEDETEEGNVQEAEDAPAAKARTTGKAAPATTIARAARVPEPPAKPAAREIFEFPPKVSGGIYADSHISLGEGRFLKLRTQIARACLLCDEQGKCWDIVRTDVDQDFFQSNIDCKEGLKIES